MTTEQELIQTEKERIDSNSSAYKLKLADLVMMQMAGNFDGFLKTVTEKESTKPVQEKWKDAQKIIEETQSLVTTPQLFPKIVDKTIQAQFGEKHAALRELGQNGIDSYEASDAIRRIVFTTEEKEEDIVLKVRDYGTGMNLETLIRDLLIPYNSGKEFDPTKIGEHGIGWYSVVDLAKMVKVTTKKKDEDNTIQALVYPEKDGWKTTIAAISDEKLTPDKKYDMNQGTEVTAYISKNDTNIDDMKRFLYQYLGMVKKMDGEIAFNGEIINFMRGSYSVSVPSEIEIQNETGKLTMGVSSRELDNGFNDSRFKMRNQNLDKIMFTQKGFFIKYDSNPFHTDTIHFNLLRNLSRMGLDFWVEVPDNVTLTKGRNNIIADHYPAVYEATYKAFENLFLDEIITDTRIIHHSSNLLFTSIADVFSQTYEQTDSIVEANETRKYGRSRRALSRLAKIGSKTIDVGGSIAKGIGEAGIVTGKFLRNGAYATGKGIVFAGKGVFYHTPKFVFVSLPKNIAEFIRESRAEKPNPDWQKRMNEMKENIKRFGRGSLEALEAAGKYTCMGAGGVAGGIAGGYLTWKAYDYIGPSLLLHGVEAAGIIGAGYLGYKFIRYAGPRIIEGLENAAVGIRDITCDFIAYMRERENKEKKANLKNRLYNFRDGLKAFLTKERSLPHIDFEIPTRASIFRTFGLYRNIEEKREEKRQRKINKISKKYLSLMHKNDFLRRIMHKEIILAEKYTSAVREIRPIREDKKPEEFDLGVTFKGLMKAMFNPVMDNSVHYDSYGRLKKWSVQPEQKAQQLEKTTVKVSIDQLIKIFLDGKLRKGDRTLMNDGDYWVDQENPIVEAVVSRLETVSTRVAQRYDIKVLEDHLDNIIDGTYSVGRFIKGTAKGLGKTALYLTGVGPVLIVGSKYSKHIVNPYKGSTTERATLAVYNGCGELASKIKEGISEKRKEIRLRGSRAKAVKEAIEYEPIKITKEDYKSSLAELGQACYEALIKPAGRILNPIRYPGYISVAGEQVWKGGKSCIKKSAKLAREGYLGIERGIIYIGNNTKGTVLSRIAEYCENRKQRAELAMKQKLEKIKRKEEKAQKKQADRELLRKFQEEYGKNLNLNDSIRAKVSRFYLNWIKRVPNREYSSMSHFDNIPASKFKRISELTGKGKNFVNYIEMVTKLDGIVSEALGEKPSSILIHDDVYGLASSYTESSSYASQDVLTDNTKSLHVLLTKSMDQIRSSYNIIREENGINIKSITESPAKTTALAYRLIDDMIHLKTHQYFRVYVHKRESGHVTTVHPAGFYEKKAELTERVANYLDKQKINPVEIAQQHLPSKDNLTMYSDLTELTKIVNFLRNKTG